MVGIGCAVECSATGVDRFSLAQSFVQFWQTQFIYATLDRSRLAPLAHFFCSTTFFAEPNVVEAGSMPPDLTHARKLSPPIPYFEPAYLFVPQFQLTTCRTHPASLSTVTFNHLMTARADVRQVTDTLYAKLSKLIAVSRSQQGLLPKNRSAVLNQRKTHGGRYHASYEGFTHFKPAVKAALQQIQTSQLHKVVLADVMDVEGAQPFDEVRSLQALRQNHPDCTVFSIGNGRGQSFIGASPERLLSITDGRFTTDALAGTISRGVLPSLDIQLAQTLVNSEKEQFEHRLVVEFIVRQLRSLGLTPEYEALPRVLQLLHVQHLHTPISANISPPQSISPLDILAKLHPTPAVAGVPHQAACRLIRQYETFDRGLYAAPLGWIDTQGNSEFVVGIRSALLNGQKARLYAGAGIVAGSEPAKELAEIKLKLQALLNALV
ncbi:isochorismate synthase [cf. Phormidesmis sp. LEGE 11477]|nr:isochorismate synthase [cf. Phormidesmis sp. LEGE 11477]